MSFSLRRARPSWSPPTVTRRSSLPTERHGGALTSHGGEDFEAICRTFSQAGYRCGALVINAGLFLPQSRPRLFFVGVHEDLRVDPGLLSSEPLAPLHTRALRRAHIGAAACRSGPRPHGGVSFQSTAAHVISGLRSRGASFRPGSVGRTLRACGCRRSGSRGPRRCAGRCRGWCASTARRRRNRGRGRRRRRW